LSAGYITAERRAEIAAARRQKTRAKIIDAAFDLFGDENGLFVRIEDVADRAGLTRPTFYNHFSGMRELRDAMTHELTHDFLTAVTDAIGKLDDPREKVSAALQLYLRKVLNDARWGWSIINLSSNGVAFGAETYQNARRTVSEGLTAGLLRIADADIGRDIVLGTSLAAVATMLRGEGGDAYPQRIARSILMGLGVPEAEATQIANRTLPKLTNL